MISVDYATRFAAYNGWMNDRLYDCAAQLDDAERTRDVGAFFKSIHGTFNHALLADRLWMARFRGEPFAVRSLAEELYADFAALRVGRRATDAMIAAWASTLTAGALDGDLVYTSIVDPKRRTMPMWLAVTHFFNHQTHHRGQLTTMLSQRRIDPGVTDLMWAPSAFGA